MRLLPLGPIRVILHTRYIRLRIESKENQPRMERIERIGFVTFVPFVACLMGVLNSQDFLPDGGGEIHKHKLIPVEKIIFPTFVDNAHEMILGSSRVRDNLINLT